VLVLALLEPDVVAGAGAGTGSALDSSALDVVGSFCVSGIVDSAVKCRLDGQKWDKLMRRLRGTRGAGQWQTEFV
jgi:hypothetical protein